MVLMAERMRVEGGKVTVEAGAPLTSVDFLGSTVALEIGVTLRNCTIDVHTVVSTVPAESIDDTDGTSAGEAVAAPVAPPVPPLPRAFADVEL